MFYLPDVGVNTVRSDGVRSTIVDEYAKKILKKIIDANVISQYASQNSITLDVISYLLTSRPDEIIRKSKELMESIVMNYTQAEFETFTKIKDKSYETELNDEQKDLYTKYKDALVLYKIFDYDRFVSNSSSTSYDLARKLNCNTCVYCNRIYTSTVIKKDMETGNENPQNRLIRPYFDHWYSKVKHPLLALSFYNLIPCCSFCNSYLKGDKEFSIESHIHPYCDTANEKFKFSFYSKSITENSVKVKILESEESLKARVEKTLLLFRTEDVYSSHDKYELQDIINLRIEYSSSYIENLLPILNKTGMKENEFYSLLLGPDIGIKKEKYLERPLSKFRNDLVKELFPEGYSLLNENEVI